MSQYQDEELGRQRVLKKWNTNFRLEQLDYWHFQMFRCSRKVSLVRRKTSCFTVTFQRDFPEPFCKWKATQTSLDSRAAGTCLFLPSFVLHFEKERETEIAASAFRNFIWRHFLNVCHTFDISR